MNKYFEMKNIKFKYDNSDNYIFKDFNLYVDENEIILIKGRSGIGKSSLLKLISGIEKQDEGQILLEGVDITNLNIEKRNIGYLFQEFAIFPHLNVEKNISYSINKWSKEKIGKKVKELLKLIELEGFEKRYPSTLSGGEKQRVALARAIAKKPKLLLLDEPFSSLNEDLREKLREDLKKILKKEKITAIIVSHDSEDEKIVDRVVNF